MAEVGTHAPQLIIFGRQAEAMERYALSMRVAPTTDAERVLTGELLRQARGLQTILEKLRRTTTAD